MKIMAADKAKKAKTPDALPNPGDPERKRVLNVLAQRRYRQKRREKIAQLEAKLKSDTPPSSSSQPQPGLEFTTNSLPVLPEDNDNINVEEVARTVPADSIDLEYPSLDFGQEPMDLGLYSDVALASFSGLDSSDQLSPSLALSTHSYSTTPTINLPLTADGSHFELPLLPVLQAFGLIAATLDIAAHIYNPSYLHILPPTPNPSLPPNLHPTPAQITIPHHPALDTLPWPSAREKLICIFALPSACRPPAAQDDEGGGQGNAIVRMMQDIDDWKEGMRNHGNTSAWANGNELVEEAWEVGECFYQNWWWCLDRRVVEMSNVRRRERGLGRLRIKG